MVRLVLSASLTIFLAASVACPDSFADATASFARAPRSRRSTRPTCSGRFPSSGTTTSTLRRSTPRSCNAPLSPGCLTVSVAASSCCRLIPAAQPTPAPFYREIIAVTSATCAREI